jgi:sucrose phosphorylase
MLGCHDGIPVLDLKGKLVNGVYNKGLLEDSEIEGIMSTIMERGGRVKKLYDPSGNKISLLSSQRNIFSALGEDQKKLLWREQYKCLCRNTSSLVFRYFAG